MTQIQGQITPACGQPRTVDVMLGSFSVGPSNQPKTLENLAAFIQSVALPHVREQKEQPLRLSHEPHPPGPYECSVQMFGILSTCRTFTLSRGPSCH